MGTIIDIIINIIDALGRLLIVILDIILAIYELCQKYMTWRRFAALLAVIVALKLTHVFQVTDFIPRAEADEKLRQVCMASSEIYQAHNNKSVEIDGVNYQWSKQLSGAHREVVLAVIESGEKFDKEKKYHCIFADKRPWGGIEHIASPYAFMMDDQQFLLTDVQTGKAEAYVVRMFKSAQSMLESKEPRRSLLNRLLFF